MNLFENLQTFKEFDKPVKISNKNYKRTLKEIIDIMSTVYKKELIPKQCNEIIEDIYYKVIELKEMFDDDIKIESKNNNELFALRREAQVTLSHYTTNQIDYIKRGYEKFVKEIGDAYVDERESNASQIKNELAADCVENEIVTSEEFEDIWNAFEKLSKFNSHANA